MMARSVAIILAAGKGMRMGWKREKAFYPLRGKPLLAWTLSVFESFHPIQEMVVVVPPGREEEIRHEIIVPFHISKARLVSGGLERQYSIENGLSAIEEPCELVLIHDGARPFVRHALLRESLAAAQEFGASVAAVTVKDTIKVVNADRLVQETLDRNHLWAAQTPQAYQYLIIKQALEEAKREHFVGTDDASLVERIGRPVRIIPGSYTNLKITTPEDLLFAEAIAETMIKVHQPMPES